MSVIPRVALVPSISEDTGPLSAFCIVRSPAPNILSTSSYLLVTVHKDGILRLWTTDDGRCILASQPDLLPIIQSSHEYYVKSFTNPSQLSLNGVVALTRSDSNEILMINIYRMTIVKRFRHNVASNAAIPFKISEKCLIIKDLVQGKILIWTNESIKPSQGASQRSESTFSSSSNSLLLEITNAEDSQISQLLAYKHDFTIDTAGGSILATKYLSDEFIIIARSQGIDVFTNRKIEELITIGKDCELIQAKFIKVEHPTKKIDLLLTLDAKLTLKIFDMSHMSTEIPSLCQIHQSNLFDDSQLFEPFSIKTEGNNSSLLNDQDKLKKYMSFQQALQHTSIIKYNKDEQQFYTTLVLPKEKHHILATWSIRTLLENIIYSDSVGFLQFKEMIPLVITSFNLFQSDSEQSSLLNFQPLLIKSFYNRHQFSFFYSEENVTDSVIYTSADHPCYIFGTNFGRIFMVGLFQESDDKVQPILVIDSHHSSPVIKLFISYNSSRIKQFQKKGLLENGGHLISVSEDGTIAITNLNSGEINNSLHNYTAINSREVGIEKADGIRADQHFRERIKNRTQQRRNSFSGDFSVSQYYHLVRVRSQRIFSYASFGAIDKIVEVKSLNALHQILSSTQKGIGRSKRQNMPESSNEESVFGQEPSYACISSEGGTINILHITNINVNIMQLSGFGTRSDVLGIYQDHILNQIYVLTISQVVQKQQNKQQQKVPTSQLQLYVYNSKSCTLLRKLDQKHALDIFYLRETLDYLLTRNEGFKFAVSEQSLKASQQSLFDYEGFQSFFKNNKDVNLLGIGSHKMLDYMSLGLNLPLEYHPHSLFSTKYTKTMRDLMSYRKQMSEVAYTSQISGKISQVELEESQIQVVRALNDALFLNNRLYKSDFNEEYFIQQSGVTCLTTAPATLFGSRQQNLVIANTKQMLKILQVKMGKNDQDTSNKNSKNIISSPVMQSSKSEDENIKFEMIEEESKVTPQSKFSHVQQLKLNDALTQSKWPTRLLSLVHPFNIEVQLDDALERFMGLNLPFLDFRVGVQGYEESFSFVVTREDEEYHSDRNNPTKIIRIMRLSEYKQSLQNQLEKKQFQQHQLQQLSKLSSRSLNVFLPEQQNSHFLGGDNGEITNQNDIEAQMDSLFESEPSVRFFGSEQWKISSYLSTVLPTFFLSMLTAVVDYQKEDVTQMIQEWLFIVQRINTQRTITQCSRLSLSAVSKVLLKKEPSISATGRDVLLKPVLFSLTGTDRLSDVLDEWTALILDTYHKLKKESSLRQTYDKVVTTQSNGLPGNNDKQKQLVNQYFGELELRGLICVSYFALYSHEQLDVNLQYRISKLTTILTREIVAKFFEDRRYIHLLTHLLQLLSTWMKTKSSQFTNSKAMVGEVIRLLLFIYNINKSPLNRDAFITRVTGENFYLIKPTQAELFLKLTAAKTLLEIGENFTHDFLAIIHTEATHLNQGGEYQYNVLEILKIFINSSSSSSQNDWTGANLESHLIQITQILLKCFDPNEHALRKNSHRIVSIIMSIMVKMFPMVAFHHESQRLAVGTHEGPIAIYDMRTSAKWKILAGHTGNITCLQFDSKGNLLASYSAVDRTLQLWKVNNTGFFSTIMGGTDKSSNKIPLRALQVHNPHAKRADDNLVSVKQSFVQQRGDDQIFEVPAVANTPTMNSRSQQSGTKRANNCYVKFIQPKEKEVELRREDGLVERHKLVK